VRAPQARRPRPAEVEERRGDAVEGAGEELDLGRGRKKIRKEDDMWGPLTV